MPYATTKSQSAAFIRDLLGATKQAAETPATNSRLMQLLLPSLLLGTAGAGYGAMKAPGKSSLRGALIGGLTGVGAGAGLVGGTELINSPYGQAGLQGGGPSAATLVGGTALGAAGGMAGGRNLAKWLGLGSERDKTDNDLKELDIRLLPSGLRDYVKSAAATPLPVSPAAVFVRGLVKQSEKLSTARPSKPFGSKNWTLSLGNGKSTIRSSTSKTQAADKPTDTWADKLKKVEARQKEAGLPIASIGKGLGALATKAKSVGGLLSGAAPAAAAKTLQLGQRAGQFAQQHPVATSVGGGILLGGTAGPGAGAAKTNFNFLAEKSPPGSLLQKSLGTAADVADDIHSGSNNLQQLINNAGNRVENAVVQSVRPRPYGEWSLPSQTSGSLSPAMSQTRADLLNNKQDSTALRSMLAESNKQQLAAYSNPTAPRYVGNMQAQPYGFDLGSLTSPEGSGQSMADTLLLRAAHADPDVIQRRESYMSLPTTPSNRGLAPINSSRLSGEHVGPEPLSRLWQRLKSNGKGGQVAVDSNGRLPGAVEMDEPGGLTKSPYPLGLMGLVE